MIRINNVSEKEVKYTIEKSEFSIEMLSSSENVALIMTQDWCSQWTQMSRYINESLETDVIDIDVYVLIYNDKPFYNDFMNHKEKVWGNNLIPYIRYYKNGKLFKETNYVWKDIFFSSFK